MVSSQRFHRPPTVKGNEWHVAIGRHPGDKQNLSSYFLSSFSICNVFMQNLSFFCVRCTRERKKMVKEIYNKRSAIWYIAMHNQCACHDLAYVRQYECMHLCVRPPVQFSQSIYTHEAIATVEKHTPPPHSLTVSGKQNSQIKSVWV